jgi:transcriptional regulator with XRE-family HTH domain
MVVFRRLLGEVLRAQRMRQGRTLRQVSAQARVSLGYISEVERGHKEASSELLASLCAALDVPLSVILAEVSDAVAVEETRLERASRVDRLELASRRDRVVGSSRMPAGRPSGDVVAAA